MENQNYEILISTCDKFSDLWEANVYLLNKNWSDRNAKTYLVTDAHTDREFDRVEVICAGEAKEITDRLRVALEQVKSEYVIFTLDDYFFTQTIDQRKICAIVDFMEKNAVDYTQLYPQPKYFLKQDGAKEYAQYPGVYSVDLTEGNYKVVLTPGIWRTDFMRKTLTESLNPWQYEVSLTESARKLGAKCATSNCGELPYLDVVRKGKLLRKAYRYFQQNPIYHGQRPVLNWSVEAKNWIRTQMNFYLPKGCLRLIKKILIRCGMKFYSPVS